MKLYKPQPALFWLAGLLAVGMAMPAAAQRGGGGGSARWQQRQDKPRSGSQDTHPARPNNPQRQDRPANRTGGNQGHLPPPNATINRPSGVGKAGGPPSGVNQGAVTTSGGNNGVPPRWMERLRDMSPQQQDRFFQNNQKFNGLPPQQQDRVRRNLQQWNSLTPQQRMDMRDREQVWNRMTPEQRAHVRNDVLPKWQQMPTERKRVVQQKLRVLQNMPESARNSRLSDPNFTRGMSEEDKSLLKDLSHLHVGGAPDPPQENPQE